MAERGWQLSGCLCLLKAILLLILSPQNLEAAIPRLGKTVYAPVYVKQYRNYASVQMFKFEVPLHAHSAVWTFMSNASSPHCPKADIEMLIQPAGFPLPLPLNTSFPKDSYLHRTNLQIVPLGSEGKTKTLTVGSPAPGAWFGAAYIVGNTDVVIKKMTDMKCQYILAVNMTVYGYEYIPEVMTRNTNHPQKLFLEEEQTLSYLKFKIGKRTWSYDIYLTQCYSDGVLHDPCPLIVYVRSESLPSLSREETLYKNCSKGEPGEVCHIHAIDPIADSYQYIMLLKPGGSMSFYITVTTKECGDATKHFFSDEEDQSLVKHEEEQNSVKRKEDQKSVKREKEQDSVGDEQNRVKRFAELDDDVIDPLMQTKYRNICISAMPLYRTTEVSNNFVTTYALKPSRLEFVENIVPVPSLFARVFYFEVVPGQDTGGTIMFNLEVNSSQPKKPSSARTNLTLCLQRGQIPIEGSSLRCRAENFLQVESLSHKLNSISRSFPYPEAGTWYLALQQNCYIFNSTTGQNEPANCPHQLVLTKFDLHAMPCVNQNCGHYGQCTEYAGASHAFSVCNCKANLQGYVCDDWSKAKSRSTQMAYTLMLTLSNLFFIPAIILATYRHRFTEAFIYFANMFFSSFYHACDMGPWSVYTLCIMPYHVLQYCDFLCSILSIWFTLIAVSEIRQPLYSLSHMVAVIALAMAVEWNLHGLLPYILPMALGIGIIICNFGVKSYQRKKWYPGKRRCIVLALGLLLAVTGICVYSFLETDANYPYTHSVWHIAMSISILFFLPSKSVSRSLSGSLASSSEDFSNSILEIHPSYSNDMVSLVPADRSTALDNDRHDDALLVPANRSTAINNEHHDDPLLHDI